VCTLVIAWQVFADTPVAAAANRDELLDRPSEPPAVLETDPVAVAPRDAEAGGTWIGHNEHGLLVAITNRWTGADSEGERYARAGSEASRERTADRSRGLLVRDALRQSSAERACRYVERELDERVYEGFNLVVADATAALYVEWDGRSRRIRNFEPGVHVVVNVGADGEYAIPRSRLEAGERQATNADRVAAALAPEPGETATSWIDRASDVVSDHEYGVCVHADEFGTRSSSLLAVGPGGTTYRFADGPPCETAYREVESQI